MSDQYRRLVESSPDGILVGRHGRLVLANAAALRLCGVDTAEQILRTGIVDLFTPETRDTVRAFLDRVRPDGERERIDARIARSATEATDVEISAAALEDGTVQLTLRDVTARRHAEDSLRKSEERLALAVAGSREGVWDMNLETGDVVYSPRWKQMLGYEEDEIEPHVSAWERLVHPEDRRLAIEATNSLAHGGHATFEAEFRLRHKDGYYVNVLSRGYPVRREPDGPVVRIVGTHLDLTDQKHAEAALRQSEERLRLAFIAAQEGVWDWNLETGAVVYSPRWIEMLGYDRSEIEPHVSAWERLIHPDDVGTAVRLSESLERGADTYEGEFRLRHKAGHYVHVLSRGFPIRREAGGPVVRIVGTHFDLTARKEAEALAERQRAERARTELLTRMVFAQEDERRRIAREMHDQFGELLTTLARRIEGLKEFAESQPGLVSLIESLEAVSREIDRDVNHLVWQLRPTALDDLGLRAALANYVKDWSQRVRVHAELHSSGLLDDRLPSETETTLYRIAQEALTNVARHSRATTVDVILERRGDQVVLIVEDNGVGFDPGRPSTRRPGFGLLGMRERAALVGATLQIESQPGKGTTVLLRMTTGGSTQHATDHQV
ncbi:MAG TPA: PAS domain-containing protein [Vicinamibacterales bacterium]|nr:PAS domain-containing protein [Vicinamibacterales bacterium]